MIALALAGIPAASAKTYDVTFASPAMVKDIHLAPGHYRLRMDGTNITFTDLDGNSYRTTARVEQVAKKFSDTEVETRMTGGTDHVEEIRLQGTRTELEFNP